MPIILPLGRTVKAYMRLYGNSRPALFIGCPTCGGAAMHKHGKYYRSAVTSLYVHRVPIYRWCCAGCRATTSVLPDFLAPYAQFVSMLREGVLRRRLCGRSVGWIAAHTCTTLVSSVSERTVDRWLAGVRARAQVWTAALLEQLLRLRPGWELTAWRWDGPDACLQALCELGDACCALEGNPDRHTGVYAYCNGYLPALPRL